MIDAESLLHAERAAWDDLVAAFASVPADRFEEPTLTPEGWSPKDAMFHVAGWMRDCSEQLDAMREGRFDPAGETCESIERQNRAWFETSRGAPHEVVRRGFDEARTQMLATFVALPSISVEAVEWFEESGALHYPTHAADLRAFLERGA